MRPNAPSLWQLLSARYARGLSFAAIGPNEARILFDSASALAAGLSALLLAFLGRPHAPAMAEWLAVPLLSGLFLLTNLGFGLYTSRRTSAVLDKATFLAGSVLCSTAFGIMAVRDLFVPVAWAMFTLPLVVLPRWMTSLSRSTVPPVRRLVTDPHAPIAVLGGAGYIGTHAVAALLERGYHVRVLDRLLYGETPLHDFVSHPRFSLVQGDVTDIARLTEVLTGCRAAVHLSGLVGDPACAVDTNYTAHTNIVATRMASEVARSMGVSRFVFASSCSVYGQADAEVTETSALSPLSLYARTKIDSERELLRSVQDDFFVTILRFATVFGHSRRPRFDLVVNLFTAQAMIDNRIRVIGADQWRPFVHVRDLARAVVMSLEAPPNLVQSQVFNIGDRRLNYTILDVARVVQQAVRPFRDVNLVIEEQVASDRRNYFVSFDKARRLLDFEATVTLEDGVREMVEHFARGGYGDYRTDVYSNLATTRTAVEEFNNPTERQRLYAPLERPIHS
jgi:nucleoside-diphosphate-sugar epimerase